MNTQAEFNVWLRGHLSPVELDDDVFVEYIEGILVEDSMSEEEKIESVETFLAAAAELPSGFSDEIISNWALVAKENNRLKEIERASNANTVSQALAKSASTMQHLGESKARVLTAEEMARRQALIQQYGYDSEDEEEEVVEEGEKVNLADNPPSIDAALSNANRMAVSEEHKAKKEAHQKDHQARVERDKNALENDKKTKAEKKEARKLKAQKGERRR